MATVTDTVAFSATATLTVVVGVPPSLEDQILGVLDQDPILLGASGYLDTVFTSRLAGDPQ
jgi:hypothetical protein